MATTTTINPNLILKATETELADEYISETFWDRLAVTDASETNYDGPAPESVMVRKTKRIKPGAKYIEFGLVKQLDGEGRYDNETLESHEEPLEDMDNAVYFSIIRHGVPIDLKGLEAWYQLAFNEIGKRQKRLSIWNGRVAEQWAWQAFVYGCPDKVNAKHSTASPQYLHPTWFTCLPSAVKQATWSATEATFEDNVATDLGDLAAGDIVDLDVVEDMEIQCDNNHLQPIPIKIGGSHGTTKPVRLWVYPRAARKRLKNIFRDYWKDADARGPQNMVFQTDTYKFGGFLFVESAYIPRVSNTGDTTVALEESWAYDSDTNTRTDERTSDDGILHAILGKDALNLAEPQGLQYDYERKDYKTKEGIGTYRMCGYHRNEVYDDRTSRTEVLNQSSMILVEHADAS